MLPIFHHYYIQYIYIYVSICDHCQPPHFWESQFGPTPADLNHPVGEPAEHLRPDVAANEARASIHVHAQGQDSWAPSFKLDKSGRPETRIAGWTENGRETGQNVFKNLGLTSRQPCKNEDIPSLEFLGWIDNQK